MTRTSKLTCEVAERIIAAIRDGYTREAAAAAGPVAPSTFDDWMRRGRLDCTGPFGPCAAEVELAELDAERAVVAMWVVAIPQDWRAGGRAPGAAVPATVAPTDRCRGDRRVRWPDRVRHRVDERAGCWPTASATTWNGVTSVRRGATFAALIGSGVVVDDDEQAVPEEGGGVEDGVGRGWRRPPAPIRPTAEAVFVDRVTEDLQRRCCARSHRAGTSRCPEAATKSLPAWDLFGGAVEALTVAQSMLTGTVGWGRQRGPAGPRRSSRCRPSSEIPTERGVITGGVSGSSSKMMNRPCPKKVVVSRIALVGLENATRPHSPHSNGGSSTVSPRNSNGMSGPSRRARTSACPRPRRGRCPPGPPAGRRGRRQWPIRC